MTIETNLNLNRLEEEDELERRGGGEGAGSENWGKMDYHWLANHDPISIDANMAHIDFDDFKNEDLQTAFAFSLPSYDGGSSSGTDMSICKSEALFSSLKEYGGEAESIIQDSLTQEDFNYTDQVKPNKNAYMLTYSGLGVSLSQDHAHNTGSLPEESKLTTWSHVLRQKGGEKGALETGKLAAAEKADFLAGKRSKDDRGEGEEEEENNNEGDNRKSRSLPNISKPMVRQAWAEEEKFNKEILQDEPRLLNLYMRGRGDRNSWSGGGKPDSENDVFSGILQGNIPAKDKDAINEYLRKSRLTSIEESHAEVTSSSSGEENTIRPVPTPRQRSVSSMSTTPSVQGATPSSGSNNDSIQGVGSIHSGVGTIPHRSGSGNNSQLSRNSHGQSSKRSSGNFPDLDFLEEDCALWDAFFAYKKQSGKFQSVLKASPPLEEYLKKTGGATIKDISSLKVLLPESQHHLLMKCQYKSSPIQQVCDSLSRLNTSQAHHQSQPSYGGANNNNNNNNNSQSSGAKSGGREGVELVKVVESWAPVPEQVQGFVPDWSRYESGPEPAQQRNLNLINNNQGTAGGRRASELELGRQRAVDRIYRSEDGRVRATAADSSPQSRSEKAVKRRSYHPQDGLSQLLTSPSEETIKRTVRNLAFPKSGSQGNLCDSWLESPGSPSSQPLSVHHKPGRVTPTSTTPGRTTPNSSCGRLTTYSQQSHSGSRRGRSLAAEYPFQANLCSVPQQSINFDLTHKRGLFVSLYSAVERLLLYQDPSPSYSNNSAARCILLHEFCPALHAILEDGLKEEVITSFGRMKTSVWRFIEAVMQAGPAQRSTCDLVMLLNTKFSSEEDFKKFSGFVIGMLNMSCLHIWFSKLKWSMDTLLRFYERHAFICALHKETKLLFDELIFCLQRLFSLPFHIEMPFNSGILEEIPGEEVYKKREHCANCACSRTTSGSQVSSAVTSPCGGDTASSGNSSRSSRSARSRIPRPISLPKRLEEKLSVRAANSPQRASSQGKSDSSQQGDRRDAPSLRSPLGGGGGHSSRAAHSSAGSSGSHSAVRPRPKSRVRDTIKLFDAKSSSRHHGTTTTTTTKPVRTTAPILSRRPPPKPPVKPRVVKPIVTSPKTGGGEGLAADTSSDDNFK